MFDFEDEAEEEKRKDWYEPIGEYIVLFSNLEFELLAWIQALSGSQALINISTTSNFSRNLTLLIDIISEHSANDSKKKIWEGKWKRAEELAKNRNKIAHNPPITNFRFITEDFSVPQGFYVERKDEIQVLRKPIGNPGSGLSLEKLKEEVAELRSILIDLEDLSIEIEMME